MIFKVSSVILIFLCFSSSSVLNAAELSGKITVLKKRNAEPLDNLSNSIVYLTGIITQAPKKNAQLSQKNKLFSSRILPIIKGQTVEFWNRDKVKHNVFSTTPGSQFDLGRYPKDRYKTVRFDKTGKHKIYCNIHQAMITDVIVLDNHYFSLTDNKGFYHIKDIPEGEYQLHVWNIYGGENQQTITFKADDQQQKMISITNTKIIRDVESHKNKYGKSYSRKKLNKDYFSDSDFDLYD
jgi:plastocyanin